MENQPPPSGPVTLVLRDPNRILAVIWTVAAVLLIITFLLPNYSIATLKLNGIDTLRMSIKDADTLRKLFDDSSYLTMILVPILYLGLGIFLAMVAVWQWTGKGKSWVLPTTIAVLAVMIITIIGLFVIGNNAKDVPFISKLMPQTIYGYHFALCLQVLAFLAGLGYLVLTGQRVKS
jgi:hypothetical protein